MAYIMDKTGTQVEYREKGSFYAKEDGHSPVIWDEYNGELIILDKPENKEYIWDYPEKDGYIYLGGL
jgi:hypothetical protein